MTTGSSMQATSAPEDSSRGEVATFNNGLNLSQNALCHAQHDGHGLLVQLAVDDGRIRCYSEF
jgi:hypothetical protein